MAQTQLSLSYATTGSGPKASSIGWIDWGNFYLPQNDTVSVTIPLPNGLTMTFDVTNTIVSGDGLTILSNSSIPNSAFGTLGYTNVSGKIALEGFQDYCTGNSSTFTLSNISVKDSSGNLVNGYSLVVASIQESNSIIPISGEEEVQVFTLSNSTWNKLVILGNTTSPSITVTDQNTLTIYPTSTNSGSPVYTANSPAQLSINISGCNLIPQFAIGVAVSSLTLKKYINGRISTNDQFTLSISGSPSNTATTTGNNNGLQTEEAIIYPTVGNTYIINESMSPGSSSKLSDYIQSVEWINTSPDGTTPPTSGSLGQPITPDIGDNFIATIYNTPKPTSVKADPGSGPKANLISWIDWSNLNLSPYSTTNLVVPISPTISLSFDIINNNNAEITGGKITDSAFGSSLYTGLVGDTGLIINCIDCPVYLVFSNIKLINTSKVPYKYSIILADVEYSSNAPEDYEITKEFITNGAPWTQLAWAGTKNSPTVNYSNDRKTVTVTTTEPVSGSPVFLSDPPTEIGARFEPSTCPYIARLAFGILITPIMPVVPEKKTEPTRGANLFKK